MSKTLQVARREFLSTVSTKGFIVGTLIFPAIMIVAIMVIPKLITDEAPEYVGRVAVLDRTGWVGQGGSTLVDRLAAASTPEAIRARMEEQKKRAGDQAEARAAELGGEKAGAMARESTEQAVEETLGGVPQLEVIALDAGVDLEAKKEELLEGTPFDGGLLTVIVVDENAVVAEDGRFGTYQTITRAGLDDRYQEPLREVFNHIIRSARIEAAELDGAFLAAIQAVDPPKAQEMTAEGERDRTGSGFNIAIAVVFMMLLWVSVMSGGQYLMTTVITEKSNRVMEVLLSAVSPTQLMTGKVIGQMGVALAILAIYVTIGLVALNQFNLLHLIETKDLALVAVYFFLAFFFLATAMAAIGSAVTEIMEANALLTPVIMVMMIPLVLMMPLAQNPNSLFATIAGMVPPISPFVMVIREAGTDPVPVWQHVVAIGIGIVAVFGAIWATSKIFRIGVLMYGKPPNLRTMVRWVRMA